MALREIGAKLTLDGEQEWNRQMKAADRELKNVRSSLVASTAEFNGQANSVEALRTKQKLLQQQLDQQKEKVRALTQAVEDASEQYGEADARTDKFRQSLNYAQAALSKMQGELDDTTGYLQEAENSADGCATSIDGYGRAVQQADGNSGGLVEQLGELIPGIKNLGAGSLTTLGAVGALAKGVFALMKNAMEMVEQTKELRRSLSFLEVAAQDAGYSMSEDLEGPMQDLYAITGDFDSAFEALSNLMEAIPDKSKLQQAIEGLSGAVIKFPDTLKVESLADSLQETLASGDATGQFEELLSRLGVDTEDFAEALANAESESDALDIALQALADGGLNDLAQSYSEANEEALALSDAEYKLQMQQARVADSFVPLKAAVTEFRARWNEMVADLLTGKTYIAIDPFSGMYTIQPVIDATGAYADELGNASAAADEASGSTENYSIMLQENTVAVEDALVQLEALKARYDEIRAGIDNAVDGFSNMDGAVEAQEASAAAMIAALDSQIAYLDQYQANLLAASEMGLSDTLIQELSDGSVESAAYLAAIVADHGSSIDEINTKWAEVETGKQAFVDTVASLLPEFQAALSEVTTTLNTAIIEWNKYDEATNAGNNTVNGLVFALNSRMTEVYNLGVALGNQVLAGYRAVQGINSPADAMMDLMDYTVDGAVIQSRRRLVDMTRAGEALGAAVLGGYSSSGRLGRLSGSVSASGSGGSVIINIYPQTLDEAQADYIIAKANAVLGGSV